MSAKHSPAATRGGEQVGSATSLATVVLALLTALGLAAVAVIGVGQFSRNEPGAGSAVRSRIDPPAPVAVRPGSDSTSARSESSRRAVDADPPRRSLPRYFGATIEIPADASTPSVANRRPSPSAEAPRAIAVPPASEVRVLSLGKPATGHTWSGVRAGQSWSGVRAGQSWSGVKAGQSWSGVKTGQSWSGVKSGQSWSGVKKPRAKKPARKVVGKAPTRTRHVASVRSSRLAAPAATMTSARSETGPSSTSKRQGGHLTARSARGELTLSKLTGKHVGARGPVVAARGHGVAKHAPANASVPAAHAKEKKANGPGGGHRK